MSEGTVNMRLTISIFDTLTKMKLTQLGILELWKVEIRFGRELLMPLSRSDKRRIRAYMYS